MTDQNQKQPGNTLWSIADQLRGAMNADDFRDYMLSFLFLRYLSDNYETAVKKELGRDYPNIEGDARRMPLTLWYANNPDDIPVFEKQMRRKTHYVIQPQHLWNSIASMARMNMLLHGVKDSEFEIYHGDTLTNDRDILRELNPAKKPTFDAIAAQTQKLTALKTHKRGLMQQLFPSPEEVES